MAKPVSEKNKSRKGSGESSSCSSVQSRASLKDVEKNPLQILDSIKIATFILDAEHHVIYCNKAYEKITGIKREDIVFSNRQWMPFYTEEKQTLADLVVDKSTLTKIKESYGSSARKVDHVDGAYTLEIHFPHLSENGKWIFCTATPLYDENGEIIGAVQTLQDLTEFKNVEDALFKSEQKTETILDQIIDGYYEVDLYGRFISVNKALCRILGYPEREILGKSYKVLGSVQQSLEMKKIFNSVFLDDVPIQAVEMHVVRPDGSAKVIEFSVSLAKDARGVPTGFHGIVRDITELRAAEREVMKYRSHLEELVRIRTDRLRKTNRRLRKEIEERKTVEQNLLKEKKFSEDVVEAIPSVFYVVDENYRLIKHNKTFEQKLGYSSRVLEGFNVLNFFRDDARAVEEGIREVFSMGRSSVHATAFTKDGSAIPFFLTGVKTIINDAYYQVGVGIDSAELELARKALQESEGRVRAILRAVTDAMMIIDREWSIVWANEHAMNLFGEDLENAKCYSVFFGRSAPCRPCIGMQCMKQGKSREREGQLVRRDGSRMDYWNTVSPVSRNEKGSPEMILTLFRDITDKKAYQAEAVRTGQLASLGELAAGVAHEINNPINGILNYTQILLDRADGRQHGRLILERIAKEGERVASIVDKLLSFARERKDEYTSVPLHSILDDTLGLVGELLKKDGIHLKIDIPSRLPRIHCNGQQIQQVFLNIFSNARYALNKKYRGTHKNKIIEIKAWEIRIGRKKGVRVLFCDHGTGIRGTIMDKICSPFFTTKPLNEGTGLGLHISHGIIKNHAGRLSFESTFGQYTKVAIDLPAKGRDGYENARNK